MDTNQILTITVFVVVITIVGTIALAAVGYMAFRLRERRHPKRPGIDETMSKPYFFERIRLPGPQPEPEPAHAHAHALPQAQAQAQAQPGRHLPAGSD
jgi:hypothetical protein